MRAFLVILLLGFGLLQAQFLWQENGAPIRQGVLQSELPGNTIVSVGNYTYFVWHDVRNGSYDIFAQKIDENGNQLWQEGGICIASGTDIDCKPQAVATSDNAIVIAWINKDVEACTYEIHSKKIDGNGNQLWQNLDIDINDPSFEHPLYYQKLKLLSDETGGFFALWNDGTVLMVSHLNSEGEFIWVNDTVNLVNAETVFEACFNASDGLIILVDSSSLLAYRFNENGTAVWDNPLIISDYTGTNDIHLVSSGNSEYMVFWLENSNICTQKFNIDAEIFFEENGLSIDNDGANEYVRNCVIASDNQILVDCYKFNDTCRLMKINTLAEVFWNIDLTSEAIANNSPKKIIPDNDGGAFILSRSSDMSGIILHHLDQNGNMITPENGIVVCEEANKEVLDIASVFNSKLCLCWNEYIGNGGVKYQIYDLDNNPVLEENATLISGLTGSISTKKVYKGSLFTYILWEENGSLILQKITPTGELVFPEDGKKLIEDPSFYPILDFDIIETDGENIIVTFLYSYTFVNALAFDANGNQLWNDTVQMAVIDIPEVNMSFYNSEIYYGWNEFRYEDDYYKKICAQKTDADGNLLWGDSPLIIADMESDCSLCDIVDNYYIWNTSHPDGSMDIYALCLDENGNPAPGWNENGNVICNDPSISYLPQAVMTDLGLLIVWRDERHGDCKLYGQIINENGETLWEENGLLLSDLVTETGIECDVNHFDIEFSDCIYVLSSETLSESRNNTRIAVQKFNLDGSRVWGDYAVQIAEEMVYNATLKVINNRTFAFYEKFYGSENDNELLLTILDENGTIETQFNELVVSNALRDQIEAETALLSENNLLICWKDSRSSNYASSYNIYAQLADLTQLLANDESTPLSDNCSLNVFPNPCKPAGAERSAVTTISFNTTESNKNTKVEIYNIKGQKVKLLLNELLPAGEHRLTWNGRDENNEQVASGLYFTRLVNGDKQVIRKMMVMK